MFKIGGRKKQATPFKKTDYYWSHIRSLITQDTPDQDIYKQYGRKTLVSGWYLGLSSLPFDYPYPNSSAPTFSAYKRLGTIDEPIPKMSLSQEDQIRALKPPNYRVPDKPRTLINMISFPTSIGPQRSEASKLAGIFQQHPNVNKTDYKTVMKCDYLQPHPTKPSLPPWVSYKLETKYRRINTESGTSLREGICTFLDDNLTKLISEKDKTIKPRPYGLDYNPEDTWKIINIENEGQIATSKNL